MEKKMNEELTKMKQSQRAKATSLAAWRASRLHEETLPSGLPVTLRDVTMTDLLLTGKLPDAIADIATDAAKNSAQEIDLKQLMKNAPDFKVMLDALVASALVTPLIGEAADEAHITLDELSSDDKMFVFNWVNREVEQIKSFREG